MNTIEQLNELYLKHFSTDLRGITPVRFIDTEMTGVTVPNLNDDAFSLKKAVVDSIVCYNGTEQTKKMALWRGVLTTDVAHKALTNEMLFVFTISSLINDGLRQLTREIGDLSNRSVITTQRPGAQGIFRDTNSALGFELRIYVGKEE